MGLLASLGLEAGPGGLMLVGAPDSVLAEAGAMKPRPSFASSMMTAEPAARIAWWPERESLTATALQRLAWFLASGAGEAWIIIDESEELPPADTVVSMAASSGLALRDRIDLARGLTALKMENAA
ncbi:MAG: hypothetical protein ACKVT1_09565 [Dehalococcoidia bacterium]